MNLILGVSGSVAAIKVPLLLEELHLHREVSVKLVATEKALHFFKQEDCKSVEILTDSQEWQIWEKIGDPVLHIELCKWADVLLIAPLDANTLAKLANGICDNLLTCVARAWRPDKVVYFAPAMNTYMWEHPITSEQIDRLKSFGYRCIPPRTKTLACGDTGVGAMANVKDIVDVTIRDCQSTTSTKEL